MVGGPFHIENEGIHVNLPEGWRKAQEMDEGFVMTRDGLGIQKILIVKKSLEDLNQDSQKKLSSTMLPHEVAEWIADGIMRDSSLMNQRIFQKTIATVDENNGFKLRYQYRREGGPYYEGVHYGYLNGEHLYLLTYEAPSRHYFQEDLETFEMIKESYRVRP